MSQTRILIVDDSPTLRKIVKTILTSRGYSCLLAADGVAGLEVLEREPQVDLVLLDFVMPRMNGYTFCRHVRANEQIKNTPVVLMSAKAEHIREQFIRQTGAMDAITKPFDPLALVAVVEASLRRATPGRPPTMRGDEEQAEEIELEDLLDSPESNSAPRPSQLPLGHGERALRTLTTELSVHLTAQIDEIVKNATSLENASAELRACAGAENIMQIASRVNPPSVCFHGSDHTLFGNLAYVPLGEILQLLSMQQTDGTLVVSRSDRTIEISLDHGRVELAQTRPGEPEFLLGRYLVDAQSLDRDSLQKAIVDAREHEQLLGRWLLDRRIVTEEQLQSALVQQSSEIIYEVLRWRRGWFSLRRGEVSSEAELAHLGLSVSSLILEGFRRVDEWRVIEESIHFDDVLFRDEAAIGSVEPGDLSKTQHGLLKLIDGRRTVRDVVDESNQSAFDVCKTLYQLLQSRLVREFKEDER